MNLYLISQEKNTGYETYSAAVVAATTPEAARRIHPNGKGMPINDKTEENTDYTWVTDQRDVNVKLIGKAAEGVERGVMLSMFHLG